MNISDLFTNPVLAARIKDRLPEFFYLAELESSRAGRAGMEVGSARERVIIGLLIYVFGQQNVISDLPITEAEVDAIVLGTPISIKSITRARLGGIKLIWTVDQAKAMAFINTYRPVCDMMLIQINWEKSGGIYYFTQRSQQAILNRIGREQYFIGPKPGTNPRGVEISATALNWLVNANDTMHLPIQWNRQVVNYNPYERWVELWERK